MAGIRALVLRLWSVLRHRRTDSDLQQELRLHLELAAEDARRAGRSPEDARRVAAIQSGGLGQTMEVLRDQRGLRWLEDLWRDLAYACRLLAANPVFAAISVVSLAIGIGATCAVFSFADALLLRPLTVPRPADVLTVGSPTPFTQSLTASYREYLDIRDRSQSFEALTAFTTATPAFASSIDAMPKLRIGMLVSGNFFTAMGVEPQLGRAFRSDEDQVPGRDAVVILGHDFWQQECGGDGAVLGRIVRLNGIDFTVVGVTPASFTGLDQYTRFDFYAPLMMWARLANDARTNPFEARDYRSLAIRGRLKDGVTMSQAQSELALIGAGFERTYPDTTRNRSLRVRTELRSRVIENPPLTRLLAMLTTLAIAVLFVACANVAGLLASRAPVRAREIAMRLAIGAGRPRVVRQLVTESVLIALLGGLFGLGLAYAGVVAFRQFQIPTDLPIVVPFELNRRALAFSLVVAFVSAIAVGLAPAIRATRADLTAVMKSTDGVMSGRRRRWSRGLLVGGQVAVSVIVLMIATVMYRNFRELKADGPGYRTDHLLQMSFDPSLVHYSGAQGQRFFERVADTAPSIPGVRSVALASSAPSDVGPSTGFTIVPEGWTPPAGVDSVTVLGSTVDEHYFDTIGLPILRGRGFHASDSPDAPLVAVVNEQLANVYWPGRDPLGKRFRLTDGTGSWIEIVGVAKTAKYITLGESPRAGAYLPFRQRPQRRMTLLVASTSDPGSLVTPLRDMVRAIDANQPIYNVRTVDESYRMRMIAIMDILVELVAAMGFMGLGLAFVGLYGLVAYAASRRTREIGIRVAIGADRSSVLLIVVRQGLVLAVAGLGVGLLAGMGVRRALGTVFPGTGRGLDVMGFLIVGATVLCVTLLAAYLPARRAARINPADALRCE